MIAYQETDRCDPSARPRPLSVAVDQWNVEVAKKWNEIRNSKGHFISIYSPQWGHAEDLRLRRETSDEVVLWTVKWFRDRGHEIKAWVMGDNESIGICEAGN